MVAAAKCGTPELPFPTEPEERWLPVVGWEDFYEVSDMGRVRTVDHVITTRCRWGGTVKKRIRGRIRVLQPPRHYRDKWSVSLSGGGRFRTRQVHLLVLEAFVGPRPPGMEALHGAAGSHDNRLSNLSWGTHEQNMGPDKERDGKDLRGEQIVQSVLTAPKVVEIRRRYANGEIKAALAREYGVSYMTITKVVRGTTWAHVPMVG